MARPALALLLLAVLGLAGCASGSSQALDGRSDDGYFGIRLPKPYAVPSVSLTDEDGAAYDVTTDPTTPLTLVFFGYTHCPDVCQEVMASLASAMTRLDDADRERVGVVFVTTDPPRDTPAVLKDYVVRFDPTFRGLTGPMASISTLGDALGIEIAKGRKLPGGGYDVTHGASVIGVEGDEAPLVWSQGTSSAQFATDVAKALSEDAA